MTSTIEPGVITGTEFAYSTGFGNEHSSEALPGALPVGRNSPQRAPLGLYAEQHSATAFTEPRAHNRRSWVYRIRPSAAHPPFKPIGDGDLRSAPVLDGVADPNRLRWDPPPLPQEPTDFVDGLYTVGATGNVLQRGPGSASTCTGPPRPWWTATSWTPTANSCSCPNSAASCCTRSTAGCVWCRARSP